MGLGTSLWGEGSQVRGSRERRTIKFDPLLTSDRDYFTRLDRRQFVEHPRDEQTKILDTISESDDGYDVSVYRA
jgi:hypothetical protein